MLKNAWNASIAGFSCCK